MLKAAVYRCSSVGWKPSPVVALATSVDESQVAAAREDGSLEIWLVTPGSVGWHCHLTIHGNPESTDSSLVWCRPGPGGAPTGRLFSSSINGSISEWDLFDLRQKTLIDTIGVSIWQLAAEPSNQMEPNAMQTYGPCGPCENGSANLLGDGRGGEFDRSESEEDEDVSVELYEDPASQSTSLALACDDGCVRIYKVGSSDNLTYYRSLPRVSGRVLSVTWGPDALCLYSGSSDGFIRCWDAKTAQEIYRITAGLGGVGSGPELCIWALLALRCGTLVSADSTGSVQFWDSQHGTLQQAHSSHKGDVNALAAAPSHNWVYSAGSDGQVILYKLSDDANNPAGERSSSNVKKKWVYVGYTRAHTHDVRALTVAVPITCEDASPEHKIKKPRRRVKPLEFTYHRWAHLGVPVLISAGDDTKLYAYCAKEFTMYSPHDICPAPQRISIQLVQHTVFNQIPFLLVQSSHCLDIFSVCVKNDTLSDSWHGTSGGPAVTDLVAHVKCMASRKIICSAISSSGTLFSYSDHVKPSLFELKRSKAGKHSWTINKKQFSMDLPYAHCMVFSSDSSRLLVAGHDRMIYVVDTGSVELVYVFTPCREEDGYGLPPSEPPITRMFTSDDGQWLAAVNCFGDVYIFNLELQRQHWFVSRLDGAAVTAGGFSPGNSNILVVSTSLNRVYVLNVEAKRLGDWSMKPILSLPKRFQEFPGEVIGLSFPPNSNSSSVIVYSPRTMCLIDFGMPLNKDDQSELANGLEMVTRKLVNRDNESELANGLEMVTSKLVNRDDESELVNGLEIVMRKLKNRDLKRKLEGRAIQLKAKARKNLDFCGFRDPVLFVGHLSKHSVLIIDKPWMQVVRNFDAPPVHKHIYGN